MAEVFRARVHGAEGFQKDIVVKRILPHLSINKEFRARFIDEAKMTVNLRHANIVSVLDLGRIGDHLFIAMELVDGVDLAWLLGHVDEMGDKFPIPHALYIAIEMLKGLNYAHNAVDEEGKPLELVHRDVSPPNTLISVSGEVKVCDFGIAKAAERSFQTREGLVVGKIAFMAPEQVAGSAVDARTDIYSAGMVLSTMLAGDHPYKDDSDMQMIHRITSGDLPPPSSLNPDVPKALDEIVMRACALDPEDRYATAADFQSSLEDYALEGKIKLSSLDFVEWLTQLEVSPPHGDQVHTSPTSVTDVPALERASTTPLGPLDDDEAMVVEAVSFEEKRELFDFSNVEPPADATPPPEPPQTQRLRTDPAAFLELDAPAEPVEVDAPPRPDLDDREVVRQLRAGGAGGRLGAWIRLALAAGIAGSALWFGLNYLWGTLHL